jgi:hypothetical protein
MKIRLLQNIPVEAKHGMNKGREFETEEKPGWDGIWIRGDADELVRILHEGYEYEVLDEV